MNVEPKGNLSDMPAITPTNPDAQPTTKSIWPERHIKALTIALVTLTLIGFVGWAWYIREEAVKAPPAGTIDVVSATFGGNCGVEKNNSLQWVRSACSGKKQCDYSFDWRLLGNPAPRCDKHFLVEWKCSPDGPVLNRSMSKDPPQGTLFTLAC